MIPKRNADLTPNAKILRREMTKEEKRLWYDFLSSYPVRFQRQKVLGLYIADFYCAEAKLVVEVDGSEHYEPEALAYDRRRTDFLMREYGLQVLRFDNTEVLRHFNEVCEAIHAVVQRKLGASPAP